jgi:hypothetical protein
LILLTLVFVTSCAKTESKLLAIDINGSWYLNRWATYHTLTFHDSTVYVDNDIDTVFTLNYLIDDNLLLTTTQNENKVMIDTILMLTSDSLVLSGIRDVKEKRIYSRTKKE